jgi:hypothetical protein
MIKTKVLIAASLALAGSLAAGVAQARDSDVQWSVTIGTPVYGPVYQPAPVVVRPAPVYQPVPVYQPYPRYEHRYPQYRERTRWDADGDGIPNRYDRVYNPRWDRDGDGVPTRYDRHDGWRDQRWHDRPYGR